MADRPPDNRRLISDVFHPGRTSPPPNSKSVITGHRPMQKDPMMVKTSRNAIPRTVPPSEQVPTDEQVDVEMQTQVFTEQRQEEEQLYERRSHRALWVILWIIIVLVVIAIGLDLALDDNLIHIAHLKPLTHFFKN